MVIFVYGKARGSIWHVGAAPTLTNPSRAAVEGLQTKKRPRRILCRGDNLIDVILLLHVAGFRVRTATRRPRIHSPFKKLGLMEILFLSHFDANPS